MDLADGIRFLHIRDLKRRLFGVVSAGWNLI